MNNPMHKGSEGDDENEQIVDWLKAGTSFADAYSGFATVAALIFGFSSSLIWQLSDESSASAGMKVILICMTIALSGIALVVHTIHYYVIQEFVGRNNGDMIRRWHKATRRGRKMGRICLWISLGAFMLSTLFHLTIAMPKSIATVGGIIMGLGTAMLLYFVLTLRPHLLSETETAAE